MPCYPLFISSIWVCPCILIPAFQERKVRAYIKPSNHIQRSIRCNCFSNYLIVLQDLHQTIVLRVYLQLCLAQRIGVTTPSPVSRSGLPGRLNRDLIERFLFAKTLTNGAVTLKMRSRSSFSLWHWTASRKSTQASGSPISKLPVSCMLRRPVSATD